MTEVRWNGGAEYQVTLETDCDAQPETVYGVLTDLSTHTDWGGRRQYPGFRLLSLTGEGPVEPGTEFTSVGSIPMTRRRWENENTVVEARSPAVFEFRTDTRITRRPGKSTEATYEHRYLIEPTATGSRVTYRMRQSAISNPMLRMRVPVMKTMTHRVMIPFFCRRGFKNMVRLAEQRSRVSLPLL